MEISGFRVLLLPKTLDILYDNFFRRPLHVLTSKDVLFFGNVSRLNIMINPRCPLRVHVQSAKNYISISKDIFTDRDDFVDLKLLGEISDKIFFFIVELK